MVTDIRWQIRELLKDKILTASHWRNYSCNKLTKQDYCCDVVLKHECAAKSGSQLCGSILKNSCGRYVVVYCSGTMYPDP